MKEHSCTIILLCVLLLLSGCSGLRSGRPEYFNTNSNVRVILEDLDIDSGTCTVVLQNDTDADVGTGVDYFIQKQTNGKWKDVPSLIGDIPWNASLCVAKSKSSCEYNVNWRKIYGKLDKGQYRLVKEYYYLREDGMYDPSAPKNYAVFEFSVDKY